VEFGHYGQWINKRQVNWNSGRVKLN